MRLFGIFIALLVAFGSLMPHVAQAHQHPVASAHDMGKHHSAPTKDATDCKTSCVGCAAPVRMAAAPAAPLMPVAAQRLRLLSAALTGFVAPLELRPPRLKA